MFSTESDFDVLNFISMASLSDLVLYTDALNM